MWRLVPGREGASQQPGLSLEVGTLGLQGTESCPGTEPSSWREKGTQQETGPGWVAAVGGGLKAWGDLRPGFEGREWRAVSLEA